MKAVILSMNPNVDLVDITHDIEPQNITSAAFVLSACYRDFPPATIFVCVVDPGVGSDRRAVVVESNEHKFVGPDNGLFSFILSPSVVITAIENDRFFRKPVSSTFHGRDIFAPVAAHLSLGLDMLELGPEITDAVILPNIHPRRTGENTIEGSVVHIDHFGNIVTNITAEMPVRRVQLEIGGRVISDRREFYTGAEAWAAVRCYGKCRFYRDIDKWRLGCGKARCKDWFAGDSSLVKTSSSAYFADEPLVKFVRPLSRRPGHPISGSIA